ncbi:hypothetical protein ES703_81338 [subsurface metagenome]
MVIRVTHITGSVSPTPFRHCGNIMAGPKSKTDTIDILRKIAVKSTISDCEVKMRAQPSAQNQIAIEKRSIRLEPRPTVIQEVLCARSGLPAPRFCPARTPAPIPHAIAGMCTNISTLCVRE